MTYGAVGISIADKDGNTTIYPEPRLGWLGGMQPGDPLYICVDDWYGLVCPNADWFAPVLITDDKSVMEGMTESAYWGVQLDQVLFTYPWVQHGSVWPIRGGQ